MSMCAMMAAALFQSLLYEAAGRTINPVNGAVGLLGTGKWHLCQAAVETVLRGGAIDPLPELGGGYGAGTGSGDLYGHAKRSGGWSTFSTAKQVWRTGSEAPAASCDIGLWLSSAGSAPSAGERSALQRPVTPSLSSDESVTTTGGGGEKEPVLLNLLV
jgi:hypothetical protein